MYDKLTKLGWKCVTETPLLENYLHDDGSELVIMYHNKEVMLLTDIDSEEDYTETKQILQELHNSWHEGENEYE